MRYFWNSVNRGTNNPNDTNSHFTVNHITLWLDFQFFTFSCSHMKLTSQEMHKFSHLPTPQGADHELNQAVWHFYCPLLTVSTDSWNEILWDTVFILASWYLCLQGAINKSSSSFWNELMNSTTQTFTF